MACAVLLQGGQFSTLHLEMTTPWQPVLLCSGDGDAHHHAYAKSKCLIHKGSWIASAHEHTEGWDALLQDLA